MSDPLGYTVAWVCSNTTERVAARAFLDEEHDSPTHLSPSDENIYTLGRIWGHNVVIATLARRFRGKYPAVRVIQDLQKSFPNVRICLMVSIGGGLPSKNRDIRLGDVVVDFSTDGQSRRLRDGALEATSGLGLCLQDAYSPFIFLNTAVAQLMVEYEKASNLLDNKVNQVFQQRPRLQRKYKRPNPEFGRLYQSEVVHVKDDETCTSCGDDPSHLVVRSPRIAIDAPAVHYGLIGSSSRVLYNAGYRDRISAQTGILCYESGAGGYMSGLSGHGPKVPFLLIRGICDYCDSHRNQVWRGYASIVAAAYAKDLLRHIDPEQLTQKARIGDSPSQVSLLMWEHALELEGDVDDNIEAESIDVAQSEDEVKSAISYETDLESILSEGSHMSSQSSQSQLGSILIFEFVNLLLGDNDLGRLYPKAISKLGLAKFQRNFTRFLKRYGKDLTNEASNERQRQAGQFVCQVARRTAAQVGKTLGQGGDKLPVEQLPLLSGSNLAVVDAWLNSHEQHDPNLGREAFVDDSESSESEDETRPRLRLWKR
ncbi:hypothetical protein N7541_001286 [Penicillium brevicompactum]|uniref:Nucleoside phosphorylase domain-containing protein n=1 Tax=Penicillium brevicompactum TaxID=5074 RepID=A0A9W9V5N2_PENBR|nr:hypothetical protein N7541_001286 [Penicillium brevicompactum]